MHLTFLSCSKGDFLAAEGNRLKILHVPDNLAAAILQVCGTRTRTSTTTYANEAIRGQMHVESKMEAQNSKKVEVIKELYAIEGVKFGDFTLKSGIQSPIYFDLRVVVSYPKLMAKVSELLWEAAQQGTAEFKSVCGVPYTALPLATCISVSQNIPMLIRRKEAKDYGTKKMIEGKFEKGEKCLIIEDVVTSGGSVLETVESLEGVGLKVTDAVVLLNREQGGSERLKQNGVNLHSVITISEVLEVLLAAGAITNDVVQSVRNFVKANVCSQTANVKSPVQQTKKVLSYSQRANCTTSATAQKLWNIMAKKETNLAFSADVTSCDKLLSLADAVGPYICILKTHVDILEDFSQEFITKLTSLAKKHNFLIFEDRKFADIGNTVRHQFSKGIYKISEWADMINCHILPGEGIIDGLKASVSGKEIGLILIAQMSSKGNFAKEDYTKNAVDLAKKHKDFVFGFICTSSVCDDPEFVHLTPGVNLGKSGDAQGQQYNTPFDAICNKGSDVLIVGRGIYEASHPAEKAKEYQKAGYEAYKHSLQVPH